ncbi:MAG: GNAT family N-acetyltransferase [Flavobacterium sp.]|nr:MAG: GNAT family N-acetyltransferase [Flavobacterium sp.]
MITLRHTSSNDPHFIILVKALDEDLAIRDGEDHEFYHQFNSIEDIKYALVAYMGTTPVGCGAIKQLDDTAMEVKRMYTLPSQRDNGIASLILDELEKWARELGFDCCRLETGKQQPEALALYTKKGYKIISNYGQYMGVENSVCFQKELKN